MEIEGKCDDSLESTEEAPIAAATRKSSEDGRRVESARSRAVEREIERERGEQEGKTKQRGETAKR